jgi:hypothetical protein
MPRGLNPYDEARLQGRLWTPTLARPSLWYDASDLSTISTATGVSELRDKSGINRHLTQAVAADQPVFVQNGQNNLSTIRNGTGDVLSRETVPIFKNVGQAWIFVVLKYPTVANSTSTTPVLFFGSGLGATRVNFSPFPANGTNTLTLGGRRLDSDAFQAVSTSTTRASIQDKFIIETAHFNWSSAQVSHWTNGTQDLTAAAFQTAGNTSNTDATSISMLTGGATPTITNGVEVGEVLVYENNLPVFRVIIEGYLAHKWGLKNSLIATQRFRNYPPLIGN